MLSELYAMLDPVIFTIGPLSVRWYGLAYMAAFVVGGFIIWKVTRRWGIGVTIDDLLTLVLCIACGVIIGARLGYCLFYGDGYYFSHPLDIVKVYEGGMSFHGGFIGAMLGGLVAARITHIPLLTIVDLGAIASPIGLFFGRCANFINGELWGATTTLPWGVVFSDSGGGLLPRHPTQLYEALLEGLVICIVLLVIAYKKPVRPQGTFIGIFLILYGIFRTIIEFVRVPDVQIGYLLGTNWLTMGMCLSLPLIVLGIFALIYAHMVSRPQAGPARQGTLA